jgi:hypothetical protein
MDESAISFQTLETKRASNQWVKKGQPGPRKAKVYATRTKKMVLVFFTAKGVIYTNYVPKGKTVNTEYTKKALARFLKVFKAKRPIMSSQDWFLHCPSPYRRHGSGVSGGEGGQDASPSSLFAGPRPSRLLLLPKGEVRAGWPLNEPGDLPEELGGGRPDHPEGRLCRRLSAVDGACKKCVRIGGDYVEK